MGLWFDINMIRKYGVASYRKAKLLATAIQKANQSSGCFHNPQYWLKKAEELACDESVPTDYVPIRLMILSLHNGYVDLVFSLYGQPELIPSKDLQKRVKNLVQDLLMVHAGRTFKLELIEKAQHLIDIISAFYIIKFAKLEENGDKLVKQYLEFQALNNLALTNQNADTIAKIINKIANVKLESYECVQVIVPYLCKIIPIQKIGAKYEQYTRDLMPSKELLTKYPIDYVEKESGGIDIRKIIGLPPKDYKIGSEHTHGRQWVHSQVLSEKPLNVRHIRLIYKKILEMKTKGLDPNLIALKLQIEGIYIPDQSIIHIYYIISKAYPNPRVFEVKYEDLSYQTAPLPYIKPITPKKKAASKHFKASPENDSTDLQDRVSVRFQDDSLQDNQNARQNHTYPKDKSSVGHKSSSTTHNCYSVKNASAIQVHPTKKISDENQYCNDESNIEDPRCLILGKNHDTCEDLP